MHAYPIPPSTPTTPNPKETALHQNVLSDLQNYYGNFLTRFSANALWIRPVTSLQHSGYEVIITTTTVIFEGILEGKSGKWTFDLEKGILQHNDGSRHGLPMMTKFFDKIKMAISDLHLRKSQLLLLPTEKGCI